MSVKRLVMSLCAVVVLLVIAGVIEGLLILFPASPKAEAIVEPTNVKSVIGRIESVVENPERTVRENRNLELAHALAESAEIMVDGTMLDEKNALTITRSANDFTSGVSYIDQRGILPSGCEIIALVVALQAEGFTASPAEIVEKNLRMGNDPANDYIGSPAERGGGLPPCIADAANSWFATHEHPGRAYDATGTSFEGVIALVDTGYPVLAWITEGMKEPTLNVETGWYRPEHCVVVYGTESDGVLVSDSLEGLVRRNREALAHIYETCGRKAVLVVPST